MKNLFDPSTFDENLGLILEYREDIKEECSKCGAVKKVVVYDVRTRTNHLSFIYLFLALVQTLSETNKFSVIRGYLFIYLSIIVCLFVCLYVCRNIRTALLRFGSKNPKRRMRVFNFSTIDGSDKG